MTGSTPDHVATVPTTCEKRAYATKSDARRFIKKRRGRGRFRAKHAYRCEDCGYWHISSAPASPWFARGEGADDD